MLKTRIATDIPVEDEITKLKEKKALKIDTLMHKKQQPSKKKVAKKNL
jgi:hypothetical protein